MDKLGDEPTPIKALETKKPSVSWVLYSSIKLQEKQYINSPLVVIYILIKLLHRQDILHYWDPQGSDTREQRRALLAAEICKWCKMQTAAFPQLEEIITNADLSKDVEKSPSSFPQTSALKDERC